MRFARLVAAGFGSGYAPVAPGTVGSAVALCLGVALLWASPLLLAAAALAASLGGFWAVDRARVEGDPGWVVIDEFAGQWITLLGVGAVTPLWVAAAFVLFRVLDVTKIGPIGWADRRHGTFGVMADDIIAGIIGAAVLAAARFLLPGV